MGRLLWILLFSPLLLWAKTPSAPYLSWSRDPTTTMTIQWHSPKEELSSQIYFRRAAGEESWQRAEGQSKRLAKTSIRVHTLELTALESGTEYAFRIGAEKKVYRFRTLPDSNQEQIRFAVGGDAYYYLPFFRKMNAQIAHYDPDFVVIGGDIAYTHSNRALFHGKDWELKRWQTFFREWHKGMITSDGRLIPMLVVVGNHDVRNAPEKRVFFFTLFNFPEEGVSYRVMDIGDYFSLFLLDTGHGFPVGGEQTEWLEDKLAARAHVPCKMAAYHISAYPSAYKYHADTPTNIRHFWVPLFEKYDIKIAFEHHNHAFKRTHPLKAGKIDPEGVIYLGDGSWGVPTRKPFSPQKAWYLAESAQINSFWLVTLKKDSSLFEAVDIDGNLINNFSINK